MIMTMLCGERRFSNQKKKHFKNKLNQKKNVREVEPKKNDYKILINKHTTTNKKHI